MDQKTELQPSCSGHRLNDFTWTHCVSCLFNTAWFIYTLLLIGLTFFYTPTKQEKTYLKPRCTPHRCTPFPENMSFNLETVAKRWAVWTWNSAHTKTKTETVLTQTVWAWTFPRSVWLTNDRWGADIAKLTLKYWVNYRNHQLYWRGKLCGQSCHFCAKCHSYQAFLMKNCTMVCLIESLNCFSHKENA